MFPGPTVVSDGWQYESAAAINVSKRKYNNFLNVYLKSDVAHSTKFIKAPCTSNAIMSLQLLAPPGGGFLE